MLLATKEKNTKLLLCPMSLILKDSVVGRNDEKLPYLGQGQNLDQLPSAGPNVQGYRAILLCPGQLVELWSAATRYLPQPRILWVRHIPHHLLEALLAPVWLFFGICSILWTPSSAPGSQICPVAWRELLFWMENFSQATLELGPGLELRVFWKS